MIVSTRSGGVTARRCPAHDEGGAHPAVQVRSEPFQLDDAAERKAVYKLQNLLSLRTITKNLHSQVGNPITDLR